MALNSTIYKIQIQLSDLDNNVYGQYPLTIAKHPSETEERLMVRLVAFALYAHRQSISVQTTDALSFARGLSEDNEPDLWQKDLTGVINLWIDVGLPNEKEVRKACGRAKGVVVVLYGGRMAQMWWENNQKYFEKCPNLSIINMPDTKALAKLAQRNLELGITVQDGHLLISDDADCLELKPIILQSAKS